VSAHSLSHNHSLIAPSNPTEYSLTPSLHLVSSESHLSLHSTYEAVGKVLTLDGGMGLGLRVLGATEWPKNADTEAVIDLKAYEAVVDATHRYKGIFYENESSRGAGGYGGADDDSLGTVY
jgi:hypothetical protein